MFCVFVQTVNFYPVLSARMYPNCCFVADEKGAVHSRRHSDCGGRDHRLRGHQTQQGILLIPVSFLSADYWLFYTLLTLTHLLIQSEVDSLEELGLSKNPHHSFLGCRSFRISVWALHSSHDQYWPQEEADHRWPGHHWHFAGWHQWFGSGLPTLFLQTAYLLIDPDYSLLWLVVKCMCSLSSGGLLGMFHSGVLFRSIIVCGASDLGAQDGVSSPDPDTFQVPFSLF